MTKYRKVANHPIKFQTYSICLHCYPRLFIDCFLLIGSLSSTPRLCNALLCQVMENVCTDKIQVPGSNY